MISIIIPIIRPEKAERLISSIREYANGIKHEIISEVDNEQIGCPKMVSKLAERSKFDLIMFLGDDTIAQPYFIDKALMTMQEFDSGWGLVGLRDNIRARKRTELPAHWLAHKKLLDHLDGEFFHTGYWHCFCDNELMDRANEIERFKMSDYSFIIHDHPIGTTAIADKFYQWEYSKRVYIHDMLLYRRRKAKGWKT